MLLYTIAENVYQKPDDVKKNINIHQSAFNTDLPIVVFSLGTSYLIPDDTEDVDIL